MPLAKFAADTKEGNFIFLSIFRRECALSHRALYGKPPGRDAKSVPDTQVRAVAKEKGYTKTGSPLPDSIV